MKLTYPVADIDHGLACMKRADEDMELGRLHCALHELDRAVQLLPGFPHAHWNRVLVLLALGRYEEGFAEIHWRVQLFPSQPDAFDIPSVTWAH